jgi:hypothetical protein
MLALALCTIKRPPLLAALVAVALRAFFATAADNTPGAEERASAAAASSLADIVRRELQTITLQRAMWSSPLRRSLGAHLAEESLYGVVVGHGMLR